jgi:hypothetical protein
MWIESGQKTWEIRRSKGAFAVERLMRGRDVECRLGYSGRSLRRKIGRVVEGSPRCVLRSIGYKEAIPIARSIGQALGFVIGLLGLGPDERVCAIELL